MKTLAVIVGAVLLILAGVIGFNLNQPEEQPVGSVARASEYHYTTATSTDYINPLIKTGAGTFGSIVVNLLGTAPITFYDATTTNVNLRVKATSTLPVLAYIAPSQAAGTYTYDTVFSDGLLAIWGTGTVASTTITWR